jgi:hypothetical protein
LYLDAIRGHIDDFNEGNKLATNAAKVADEQNHKWAFTNVFNNDMFDQDETLKVKTKTIKLILPTEDCGGQLAVEVGTEWQGEMYDSEPHNEFLLKKSFVPIATSEKVYDDIMSPSVKTHLYYEVALAGRHFSGYLTLLQSRKRARVATGSRRQQVIVIRILW